MSDRSYKNKLRPYKNKRRYRRSHRGLSHSTWLEVAGGKEAPHKICPQHPRHRWLRCDKKFYRNAMYPGAWVMCFGHFCAGCYGNTCPDCGRQIKIKRRFES